MTTRRLANGARGVQGAGAASGDRCARAAWGWAGLGRWAGFTLIEIMIAVVIVVAIGALVLPMLADRARTSSAEDVSDVMEAAVAEATVRSARTGASSAIVLRPAAGDRMEVLVSDVASGREGAGAAGDAGRSVARAVVTEVIGEFKLGHAPLSAEGKGGGERPGAEAAASTTIVLVAPDGTLHPVGEGAVRIGPGSTMHAVRVDEFGVVKVQPLSSAEEPGFGEAPAGDGPKSRPSTRTAGAEEGTEEAAGP